MCPTICGLRCIILVWLYHRLYWGRVDVVYLPISVRFVSLHWGNHPITSSCRYLSAILQLRHICSSLAVEILQTYTKPSLWSNPAAHVLNQHVPNQTKHNQARPFVPIPGVYCTLGVPFSYDPFVHRRWLIIHGKLWTHIDSLPVNTWR